MQEWSLDDVSEWLVNIGLADYIDTFKKNHISGKNLLDITEVELKDDLSVCSVGHRKNFLKSQEHLKKVYSKNRVFNQTIRAKLKKFYEKHKNHLRSSQYLQFNNKFNSIRSNYNTTDIIEEDQNDQSSFKEEFIKASEIVMATNASVISSENKPLKKVSFDNFADDETDFVKPIEKETPSPLTKKKTKSPMVESVKENNKNNEECNNKIASESDSSSDSSSSSDDETNQTTPLKKKKEKITTSPSENKLSNHLHIQVPKKIQRNTKCMQYSSSLDSNSLNT